MRRNRVIFSFLFEFSNLDPNLLKKQYLKKRITILLLSLPLNQTILFDGIVCNHRLSSLHPLSNLVRKSSLVSVMIKSKEKKQFV